MQVCCGGVEIRYEDLKNPLQVGFWSHHWITLYEPYLGKCFNNYIYIIGNYIYIITTLGNLISVLVGLSLQTI